jgi:isopentenyl-diphosphate delta-isomerase
LRAPILISAMTGGTPRAAKINQDLASIAEKLGIAFALGSQRPMLEDPALVSTYAVRDQAPSTVIVGNIGLWQARELDSEEIDGLASQVGADAMALHLNVAQEIVQPDGDREFEKGLETLTTLPAVVERPLIVKETGCGIGPLAGRRLRRAGIDHVDVAGAGGTSWIAVEAERAKGKDREIGELLRDWGVPTAASVALTSGLGFRTVVASGGIRTGLDAARAIALGATIVGIARPVLQAYFKGGIAGAEQYLSGIIDALRAVMLLTRSPTLEYLREAPRVIVGELKCWLDQLGPGSSGRR